MSTMTAEQESVIQYAMETDDRVRLALMVMSVGEEIRRRIILRFWGRLRQQLDGAFCERFPGKDWRISTSPGLDVFARWFRIHVTRDDWDCLYTICLCADGSSARNFMLGVTRDPERLRGDIDDSQIRTAISQVYRPGSASQKWPFWDWAERYRYWDGVGTLMDLYDGRGALEYFAATLLQITEAAMPGIDGAVARYRTASTKP